MRLYGYWRSSASYRVRIALALKGLAYRTVPVNLAPGIAEHLGAAFGAVNPQHQVPALELDDGTVLTQSLAIIEYLDEIAPQPPLLPAEPVRRAQVRAAAQVVAADIHPVCNPRITGRLGRFGASQDDKVAWMAQAMADGLAALERLVRPGPYAFGAAPTLADLCLVPQLYNARRWGVDLAPYPQLLAIDAACRPHPAFAAAAPEAQADAA